MAIYSVIGEKRMEEGREKLRVLCSPRIRAGKSVQVSLSLSLLI